MSSEDRHQAKMPEMLTLIEFEHTAISVGNASRIAVITAKALDLPNYFDPEIEATRDSKLTGFILKTDGIDSVTTAAFVEYAALHPEYRGRGIAARMYRAFASIAIRAAGAQYLTGQPSLQALKVRDRVFGPEATSFYEGGEFDTEHSGVIIDPLQARDWLYQDRLIAQKINELRAKYPSEGYAELHTMLSPDETEILQSVGQRHNIFVQTDMRNADISGWAAEHQITTMTK
jgi:GNAT superfamily N-acetyltransferase